MRVHLQQPNRSLSQKCLPPVALGQLCQLSLCRRLCEQRWQRHWQGMSKPRPRLQANVARSEADLRTGFRSCKWGNQLRAVHKRQEQWLHRLSL